MKSEIGSDSSRAADLNEMMPHLDDALARLGTADRDVIVLRFMEGKSLAEISAAMNTTADAAKKRVARAVARLRWKFQHRDLPVAGLEDDLSRVPTQSAPPVLAASIITAAQAAPAGAAWTIAAAAAQKMLLAQLYYAAAWVAAVVVSVGVAGAVIAVAAAQISRTPPARRAAANPPALVTVNAALAEAPYVQAIRLMQQLQRGPDSKRINADAPLDAATAAFLDRNSGIFDLLHAGALAHSSDWGVGSGPGVTMQTALNQLGAVRSLAELEVLRARQRFQLADYPGGQQDMLDALALARNTARDHPMVVVMLVEARNEQVIFTRWAHMLPTTPGKQLAALPGDLKELSTAPGMADIIRAEQGYAVNSSNAPPAFVGGMAPFYDSVSAALNKNPLPSQQKFQRMLDDGASQVQNPTSHPLVEILIPSLARAYDTISDVRATAEMFKTGIAVLLNGEKAVGQSIDPFGNGPFEYVKTAQGFELRSKLLRSGKAVTLDFGM